MFEPDTDSKLKMLTQGAIDNGKCIDLGTELLETKFQDGDTQVRFMRDAAGEFTSIAFENETRNVYAYWSTGNDVGFLLTQDGHEFQAMWLEWYEKSGICF